MNRDNFEKIEKIINDMIDNLEPNKVYLYSAQILHRKVKNNEKYNNRDWNALRIILEDYMKRVEDNECKKHK